MSDSHWNPWKMRRHWRETAWAVGLVVLSMAGAAGCTAALVLLGAGAGVATGTGVVYTVDSVAYKTFATPEAELQRATLETLKRMDMGVREDRPTDSGRKIVAVAGSRTVDIEIDRLSAKATRMRVNVKQGMFLKDRATAAEILTQTERALDEKTPAAAAATRA